jgi:hypothetical protein
MTLLSRLLALFPFIHAVGTVVALALGISYASHDPLRAVTWGLTGLFVLYLLPPLLFRIHNLSHPIIEGDTFLNKAAYSPWWGGHQLQLLFIAFPTLEAVVRVIPGAYSAWLRLWGSKIGRGIYWTPRVQIIDRPLISMGDYVVWGHEAATCSHMVNRKGDDVKLYVRTIRIGSNVLIGARSQLGPGAQVEDGLSLKYETRVWVDEVITKDSERNDAAKARRDQKAEK